MSVSAHDFEVNGIYYNITSSTDKTVEVTYRDFYLNEYSGAVTIPESVTCNGKTYSVTSIGYRAFEDCSGLTSVVIPNSVTSIGVLAFYDCSGLTSVVIPNSVISIGSSVFYDCSGLTSVVISNSVTSIEDNTFRGCSGLTSVVIPESVTSIGSGAFSGCSGLISVLIGNSVTSIGDNAFDCCYSLTSIVVAEGNNVYDSRENCNAIIESETNTLIAGCKNTNIPNSVTSIGSSAFSGCYSLTSVVIPESVTSIGSSAFYRCVDLTSITSLNQTPPTIYPSTFSEYDVTLYVPYGAKSTYSTAEHWKNFTNIVELKPSFDLTVTTVGYATLYLDYATEIPAGVEVYTAKEVDGNRLKMLQIENVLPANTGVIVKAPAGTYTFAYSDTEVSAIENNLFKGSSVDEYINVPANASAFVLSMVEGEVGMYLAKLTDGRFLNNANKAYLLLDNNKLGLSDEELDTSVGGAQLSLRFDFGGATGVDKVQTETGMNNATYDIYGRKVNNITTPGLYIVNGKKVLVK